MKAFAYVTARSASEAAERGRDGGRYLAGGVDLLGEMKEGLAAPAVLVNVKALPGAREIAPGAKLWTIGAGVTLAAVAGHAELRRVLPGLARAAEEVGSPQMRNVATVGGNLAQHSRCWYYRQRDLICAKKGGKRCFARGGENKFHSVLTGCPCLSPCVSNLAVALAALDGAAIVQRGPGKTERLTIAQIYEAAWKRAGVHHSLQPEDVILRIEVPVPAAGARSAYVQVAERGGFDWALVSGAAAGRVEGGAWRGVRVALGCVAPIPWQLAEVNAWLEGKPATEANALAAAELLLKAAAPHEQNGYKVPLAKTVLKRALLALAAKS